MPRRAASRSSLSWQKACRDPRGPEPFPKSPAPAGKGVIIERFRSRRGFGGGADLLFVAGGNVNDGREIYLPTFGRRARSGDERGGVSRISDRDGARIRFLDGFGQLCDVFRLMCPSLGRRRRQAQPDLLWNQRGSGGKTAWI